MPSEFSSRMFSTYFMMDSYSLNSKSFYRIYSEERTSSLLVSMSLKISSEFLASGKQCTNFSMGVSSEALLNSSSID